MSATPADEIAADLAEEIHWYFNRKSPFVFFSGPDDPVQRFIGLCRGELKGGAVKLSPDQASDKRRALISALRAKGHEVCDRGLAERMSPAMRESYSRDKRAAVSMGLAIPRSLLPYLLKIQAGVP